MANIEDRYKILELFKDSFKDCDKFVFIDGINPCCIKFNGARYNVYIKNLTPAQLSNKNENIWRIQLPKRKAFEEIKKDDSIFLLLGYDKKTDVFATWNPYWVKQRLNIGESVSLYSRLNLQENACLEKKMFETTLNHNGKVVIFPRTMLPQYLEKMTTFFPESTEYVAIGSSLRKNKVKHSKYSANEMFLIFSNKDNLYKFEEYLEQNTTLKTKTIKNYIYCISYLFDNGVFNKNKNLFMPAESISLYKEIIETLFKTNKELIKQDIIWHGAIHAGIKKYLIFAKEVLFGPEVPNLPNKQHIEFDKTSQQSEQSNNYILSTEITEDVCTGFVSETEIERQAKDKNVDCKIQDPKIIGQIIKLLKETPPQTLKVIELIANHLGDAFAAEMSLKQWFKYISDTNWENVLQNVEDENKNNNEGNITASNDDIELASIVLEYGETLPAHKAFEMKNQKQIKIKRDGKIPKTLTLYYGKNPQCYVFEDCPLVKFYNKGATILKTDKHEIYKVIVKYEGKYRIILFKYNGVPYKKGSKLY